MDIYIGPLVIIVAVAILSAACFNALAFRFPIAYTYTALFLLGAYVIATIVVVCIYVSGATAVVAVFGVLTLLILLWTAYQLRRYKKFMAQLVATCRDVASLQRGMFGAAALTIVLQMVWASVWVIASITLLRAWGGSEAYAVQVHSIFTFYWVSELIRNLVHVTVAGSMGSWYFASASHAPQNPTMSAFRRAATYSFGSIALGSLIIAILQTLRRIFRMLQNSNSRNFWVLLLSIVARIFLYLIEALLRFFNRYCLVICALFGTSYWQSMKKTVELFANNGYEMVMQNNVTAVIISVSALLGAFTAAGAGALVAYLFGLEYPVMVAFGSVIGVFVVEGSFVVLESGSMTMMVCFLLHPEALRNKPERAALYTSLSEAQAVFRPPANNVNV